MLVHGTRERYDLGCRCDPCLSWRLGPRKDFRVKHGTKRTYNAGCHCDECREANRINQRVGNRNRRSRLEADPSLAKHGEPSTYRNWMCRCTPCTVAHVKHCHDYHIERKRRAAEDALVDSYRVAA